jgi:hypothetical protein
MVRLAPDDPSIPLKDREGTISTPFRKIFAIISLSPVFAFLSWIFERFFPSALAATGELLDAYTGMEVSDEK